jgi:hypothetical protein
MYWATKASKSAARSVMGCSSTVDTGASQRAAVPPATGLDLAEEDGSA